MTNYFKENILGSMCLKTSYSQTIFIIEIIIRPNPIINSLVHYLFLFVKRFLRHGRSTSIKIKRRKKQTSYNY